MVGCGPDVVDRDKVVDFSVVVSIVVVEKSAVVETAVEVIGSLDVDELDIIVD